MEKEIQIQRVEFKDGIYEGEAIKGIPNGKGKLTFKTGKKNGDYIEGNFTNGKINGEGKYVFAPGNEIYKGNAIDGKFKGKGVLLYLEPTHTWLGIAQVEITGEPVDYLKDVFEGELYPVRTFEQLTRYDGALVYIESGNYDKVYGEDEFLDMIGGFSIEY